MRRGKEGESARQEWHGIKRRFVEDEPSGGALTLVGGAYVPRSYSPTKVSAPLHPPCLIPCDSSQAAHASPQRLLPPEAAKRAWDQPADRGAMKSAPSSKGGSDRLALWKSMRCAWSVATVCLAHH
jgi:hypothetical protein